MKIELLLAQASMALFCSLSATPALADDAIVSHWSLTVTPRYQHVFFKIQDAEGIQSMPTYGATVTVRTPDQSWGLTGTFLTGTKKNAKYTLDGTNSVYQYTLKRREYQVEAEYTPHDTGVTLLAGYHHFKVAEPEFLANPLPGNSEVNDLSYRINAAEVGLRLASRLGAESRHSVSAQFLFGVGKGHYKNNQRELFSGFTNTNLADSSGTGYLADVALGYTYFLSQHISIGARARGYVFYVDADGSDPTFALMPEANLSFRF